MNQQAEAFEINFDGIPGPTYHYGLSRGGFLSKSNEAVFSNPQKAALQCLAKMRLMLSLGLKQGIFIPNPRPVSSFFLENDSWGDEQKKLEQIYKENRVEFSSIFSSSDMWAANSATVTSSMDTLDKIIHITPANLQTHPHRRSDITYRYWQLHEIFKSPYFSIHEPLQNDPDLSDEGAANHFRLSSSHCRKGINGFVYGNNHRGHSFLPKPKYPPRQSMQAGASIAQNHRICNYVLFFQQKPEAIDEGVFHNDIAMINNENCVIFHQDAFLEGDISGALAAHCNFHLYTWMCTEQDMPLKDAIQNYFFNSQLVTYRRQQMGLVMPLECQNDPKVESILQRIGSEMLPIRTFHYVDCSQIIKNGGGPSCLRLRIVATQQELNGINPNYLMTNEKIDKLEMCVKKYYPTQVLLKDFLDIDLRAQCEKAVEALKSVLIGDTIC